jgi:hypothetical protein
MGDWLDLLAENPTLINATLNSTGPFRWFLSDALRDGKGLDRMVTELMMMRGDVGRGGSVGFALAGKMTRPLPPASSLPHFWASSCSARCDSLQHHAARRIRWRRCSRKTVTVPATSRVPARVLRKKGRESLIKVACPTSLLSGLCRRHWRGR